MVPEGPTRPFSRWALLAIAGAFTAVCLAQAPGLIEDDTKLPMLLTPINYIETALHAWNAQVFYGNVELDTGYLLPMGFFFGITHTLGIPVWIAERIWLAGLLTLACWGVVRLAEALGIGTRASRVMGGLAFCIAPIMINRVTVTDSMLAIVLLPWMLIPLVNGSRTGSVRQSAARSGLAVALMGGANAAVVLAVLPVGAIWLWTRTPGLRRRALTLWWLIALGLACFWWVVSTILVGRYGFNYLPFTETSQLTTSTASLFEAFRGASYWTDYFNIHGPLIPGTWLLVSSGAVIAATTVVAATGLAGLCRRTPEKLFLVGSLAFGTLAICAGYAGPSGGIFSLPVQHLLQGVLGPFRNVGKFAPDVELPLALGLVSALSMFRLPFSIKEGGFGQLWTRWRSYTSTAVVWLLAVTVLFISAAPYWKDALYRPGGFSAIPNYWVQAGAWLDAHQGLSNSLLVPGSDEAQYTWGNPIDEPIQVVAHTPNDWRSIIPISSNGNIQALDAVEKVIDDGSSQPGLASYLASQGIKYLVERNDLNLIATGAPPPAQVHQVLSSSPGLTEVASFGRYLPIGQVRYGILPVFDSSADLRLRPVEIFEVDSSSGLVSTYPGSDPIVVSGDVGSSLQLAANGIGAGRAVVLSGDPKASGISSASGSTWAITDGNRRQVVSFGGIRNNESYVLGADQTLPGQAYGIPASFAVVAGSSHETVSDPVGAASLAASSYGSTPLVDEPRQGPQSAFDGNVNTAWVANATDNSIGQWISVTFDRAVPLSKILITPLVGGPEQPTISRITISTDRGSVEASLPPKAQPTSVSVPHGSTDHVKITIDAVRPIPNLPNGGIVLGAGIAEIRIPGVRIQPQLKVPDDESSQFSSPSRNPPVVVFSRPIANSNLLLGPSGIPEDPNMAREFTLPKQMHASLSGYAVAQPGSVLDELLRVLVPPPSHALTVHASSTLRSLPRFGAQSIVDRTGYPWIAGLSDPHPTLDLTWDGSQEVSSVYLLPTSQASRPTEISVSGDGGSSTVVHVPATGGIVKFPAMRTSSLRIKILASQPLVTVSPEYGVQLTVPVGLAGLSVPGLVVARYETPDLDARFDLSCGQGPFVLVNGKKVPLEVSGTVRALYDMNPLQVKACSPAVGLVLPSGVNHFQAIDSPSAFSVTSIALTQSAPSSAAPASGRRSASVTTWGPANRVIKMSAGSKTYLVVAQNYSDAWLAKSGGQTLKSVRINGWEQGYVVPAGGATTVTMIMAPDSAFRILLFVGALLLILLLIIAVLPSRRIVDGEGGPRASPATWALLTAAVITLFLVSGPLALVVAPLIWVGRRWGRPALTLVAFAAFVIAGSAAALRPAVLQLPISSAGAFGRPAQIFSAIALGAVLVAAASDWPSSDRHRVGPRKTKS